MDPMRPSLRVSAVLALATLQVCAFAPSTRALVAPNLRGARPSTALTMSAAPPPPPGPEFLPPPPSTGRALLSWANAPYLAGAAFVGYRGYKTVVSIKDKHSKLIDEFGGKLKLGKKQTKAQFAATKSLYGKKLMFLPRGPALFASGLKAITTKKVSISSLTAFRDLCDVFGVTKPDAIAAAVETAVSQTNARGKALFYANRSGLSSPKLVDLAAEGLDGSKEFLEATQVSFAEQAYTTALGVEPPRGAEGAYTAAQLAKQGNYQANQQAASALGMDPLDAQRILDDLNALPDPDAGKEDWQKYLEAKVVAETGALPDKEDVDMTDSFDKPTGNEEMMLTCECGECGYTLFIAAGREGKFFGDTYKCPECGAPKSKFSIDEAPSA